MSLRARLLAAFAYSLLVVIVALEVPLANNLAQRVDAEVEAEAGGQAQIVAAAASRRLDQRSYLERLADRSAQQIGGRVVIVDARGRLRADSAGAASVGDVYATPGRPELIQALARQISQGQRHSESLDEELLVTAVPILDGDRIEGAVRVTQAVGAVNSEVRSDVLALVGLGFLAIVLGLGVAWILAGSISRPTRALAAVASRMADGDLRARADPRGSREQAELARAFNEMAERVGGLVESQRAFVADASHQLRTPLTGLRLRIEAAVGAVRDAEVARDLEAAERETERLADLVDELLTLAASEQPGADAGPVELSSAVADAARRWEEPAREAGRSLRVAEGGPAQVRSSPGDLAAMLDNLIDNAIKYSGDGSAVEVGWETRDGHASLRVGNEGRALSGEEIDRAFERFYRGDVGRRSPGTGLGLAIVAALARRSGGRARLANGPGGRVVAEVELPLA